jgi:hypothetical protein
MLKAIGLSILSSALLLATENPWNDLKAKAESTKSVANQLAQTLKQSKSADPSVLNEHTAKLDQHVDELKAVVAQIDASNLNAKQREEFEKMKQIAEVMDIFVENKKNIIANGDLQKQRRLLQAKAEGIALRSDLLLKSAAKIKS